MNRDNLNLQWAEQPLNIASHDAQARVQFFRLPKQYGHVLSLASHDQELVAKTRDDSNSAWPASPPIQDVHFEDRTSCQVLFGVGMAGTSHYSVSIESDCRNRLKFEFACHVKSEPEFLGVIYQLDGRMDRVDKLIKNQIEALPGSHIVVEQDSDESICLMIKPDSIKSNSLPTTMEWGFLVSV